MQSAFWACHKHYKNIHKVVLMNQDVKMGSVAVYPFAALILSLCGVHILLNSLWSALNLFSYYMGGGHWSYPAI